QGGPLRHAGRAGPAVRPQLAGQRARAGEPAHPRGRARQDRRARRDAAADRRGGHIGRRGRRRRGRRRRSAADPARAGAPPHHPRARPHRVEQAPGVRDPRHQPADARSQDRGVRAAAGGASVSLGLVPLAIAAIGASYAALVLRGWRRRDNLMFGLLALTDALMVAWRGVNVLTGGSIIAASVLVPCMLGTVVLALLTLEFVTAFPRRPPMRPRWRAAMLVWGAIGAAIADTAPPPSNGADSASILRQEG